MLPSYTFQHGVNLSSIWKNTGLQSETKILTSKTLEHKGQTASFRLRWKAKADRGRAGDK